MKIRKILALFTVLSIILALPGLVYGASGKSATVESFEGTVYIRRSGGEKDMTPFKNMKLQEGDKVVTEGDGRIKISIDDNKFIVADPDTSFSISNLKGKGNNAKTGFTLIYGSVSNEVNQPSNSEDTYKIETANTVMGVRSTVFKSVRGIQDGKEVVQVIVLDGTVYVKPKSISPAHEEQANTIEVPAGNMATFESTSEGLVNPAGGEGSFYPINPAFLDENSIHWIIENEQYVPELSKQAEKVLSERSEGTNENQFTNAVDSALSGGSGSQGDENQGEGIGGGGGNNGNNPAPLKLSKFTQSMDGSMLIFEFNSPINLSSSLDISPSVSYSSSVSNEPNGKIEVPASAFTSGVDYTIGFHSVKGLLEDNSCTSTGVDYKGDAYYIHNMETLEYFRSGQITQKYILLTKNLNAAGYYNGGIYGQWTPVNLNNQVFMSDPGNGGHTRKITNLTINATPSFEVGFFGLVKNGAVVENVLFENLSLYGNAVGSVGLVAGKLDNAMLKNVTISGNSTIITEGINIGGIVGEVDSGGEINNCTVLGDLRVQSLSAVSNVGGVAGTVNGATVNSPLTGINGDHVNIMINSGNAGGYVGEIDASIVHGMLVNTNDRIEITATSSTSNVGGVIGLGSNTPLTKLTFIAEEGFIKGNTDASAGGIIGTLDANASIQYSSFNAKDPAFLIEATGSMGTIGVGGIAGAVTASANTISECFAIGGRIKGVGINAGGIAGTVGGGGIYDCYGIFDRIESDGYGAGIAGDSSVAIERCFSIAKITGGSRAGIAGSCSFVSDCVFVSKNGVNNVVSIGTTPILSQQVTETQLADISDPCYTNWDFSAIWNQGPQYPMLKSVAEN